MLRKGDGILKKMGKMFKIDGLGMIVCEINYRIIVKPKKCFATMIRTYI